MKKILSLIIPLALFTACEKSGKSALQNNTAEASAVKGADPVSYPGYDLLWNDEFKGTSTDLTKWTYETGTGVNGDFGTGQLDRATDRPVNVSIVAGTPEADGALSITTVKESYMDREFTSGRINSKGKLSIGPGTRIEARIWARDVKYKGQGFAFWMLPDEIPQGEDHLMWPQGGEVDIMEYVGTIPYANLGTVHYAWSWENNTYQDWNHGLKGGYYSYAEAQVPAVKPEYGGWPAKDLDPKAGSGAYHIYRIDWFADRMEFSIDQQVYHINYFNDGAAFGNAADGQDADGTKVIGGKNVFFSEYSHHFTQWKPFDHKFYLILSAGVGGNDNQTYGGRIVPEAKFPCTTLVDWVRVYKRK